MTTSLDCAALFEIFTATGGASTWKETYGWNAAMVDGHGCCNAYGVGCVVIPALQELRVTSLDLSNNGLDGILPDGVFEDLDFLKYLDLSNNELDGAIPTSLNDLVDDAQVILSNNSFFGAVPDMGLTPSSGGSCILDGNPGLTCNMAPNTYCSFGRPNPLPDCKPAAAANIGSIGSAPNSGVSMDDLESAISAPALTGDAKAVHDHQAMSDDSAIAAHKAMVKGSYGYDSVPVDSAASSSSSSSSSPNDNKPKVPLAGILGGAIALLVVGAVTPAAVLAIRRRRAAAESTEGPTKDGYQVTKSDDASTPTPTKWFGSVSVGKSKSKVGVDIPSSFERGSSRDISSHLATSNVRRFNVDGAYPGMPGFREDEEDKPAFTPSRRGSAMSVTSEMSDDGAPPSRRPSNGKTPFQLQDPILERASEDLARDLEEAGAAKSSESPYGATTAKPSTVGGFFSRLMGGSRTPVAADDDEEAAVSPPRAKSPEFTTVTASNGQMDAKSLYSHQTQYEVKEGLVQQVKATSSSTGNGSYTGFTAPGSSAAKRAASRAKKGRNVPNVTPTRGGSM